VPSSSAPIAPSTGGSAGTSGASGATSGATSGGNADVADGSATVSRPASASRALRAAPARVAGRVVTRLRFTLPEARRVFLIVRGPLPSCRVVGTMPLRAHAGRNTFHFRGRVRKHVLAPGDYLITISSIRRPRPGDPVAAVRVVSQRRAVPLERPVASGACTAQPLSRFVALVTESETLAGGTGDVPRRLRGSVFLPPLPSFGDDVEPEPLGVAPPFGSVPGGDTELLDSFAAFAVLAFVGVLLGLLVTFVARFLAGSWDP
jgi:hypothetical protein